MKASMLFVLASICAAVAAPVPQTSTAAAAKPCFIIGTTALPTEVQNLVPTLARSVTCDTSRQVGNGIPDLKSGSTTFSSVDFQKSKKSPLGFALEKFATPANPANANAAKLQEELNVYLAFEVALRSKGLGGRTLTNAKVPKFFLQFQMARVQQAKGQKVTFNGGVEHQRGKVLKNAAAASATNAELDAVKALP
ncbi:hypothetical protein HK104_006279 [Borealophlyctis nickersoniae]|nr:hypothetical protein HK104_006279 [Borealophlyctis nickersoniae]